jgi:hypothetical protein
MARITKAKSWGLAAKRRTRWLCQSAMLEKQRGGKRGQKAALSTLRQPGCLLVFTTARSRDRSHPVDARAGDDDQ